MKTFFSGLAASMLLSATAFGATIVLNPGESTTIDSTQVTCSQSGPTNPPRGYQCLLNSGTPNNDQFFGQGTTEMEARWDALRKCRDRITPAYCTEVDAANQPKIVCNPVF